MSPQDYFGRSNALKIEMLRIRAILDWHAYAKALGVASDDNPLIQKTLRDQDDLIERFKALEREFWGHA